jgi:hypothetical protein
LNHTNKFKVKDIPNNQMISEKMKCFLYHIIRKVLSNKINKLVLKLLKNKEKKEITIKFKKHPQPELILQFKI